MSADAIRDRMRDERRLEAIEASGLRRVARREGFRGACAAGQRVGYVVVTAGGADVGGPYADRGFARTVARDFAIRFEGGMRVEAVRLDGRLS